MYEAVGESHQRTTVAADAKKRNGKVVGADRLQREDEIT